MSQKTWHIKGLLKVSTDYLEKKGIESPRLNAEVLLAHLLNMERVDLYLNFDQPLTQIELDSYRSLIKRRIGREPLQYITGTQEFWSLDFAVNRHVLIPRPETEIVVEQAITVANEFRPNGSPSLRILDIGTGCGAIAIALAKEIPEALIWATDISDAALEVARLNALTHDVSDKIAFEQGDLWEALSETDRRFDIIVSNPPYVSSQEYTDLVPEIRDYEPETALDGRVDGMFYLKKIIQKAWHFLNSDGWIILEMAPQQTQIALDLMEQIARYEPGARIRDYSRRYRVVKARVLGRYSIEGFPEFC